MAKWVEGVFGDAGGCGEGGGVKGKLAQTETTNINNGMLTEWRAPVQATVSP